MTSSTSLLPARGGLETHVQAKTYILLHGLEMVLPVDLRISLRSRDRKRDCVHSPSYYLI
jgi:hypothetical protein